MKEKRLRIAETVISLLMITASCILRIASNVCNVDYKDRFQWAKCITEGMIPYRDFSMLQTPLSIWYYSLFFRVSRSLHTGLFAATLLLLGAGLFVWLICRKISENAHVLPVAVWLSAAVAAQGAIYNSMSLLLWTAALYVYYCYREQPRILHLIIVAALTCCVFFSKQNMGAYCLASMGLCFIVCWIRRKTPLRTAALHTGILLLCYALCWGLWLGLFALLGNLREFTEYCLRSAGGFVSFHMSVANALPSLLPDIAVLLIAGLGGRQPELGITGACMALLAFPIYNTGHTLPAYAMLGIMLAVRKISKKPLHILYTAAAGLCLLSAAWDGLYIFYMIGSGRMRQYMADIGIRTMDDIVLERGDFRSAAPYLEREHDAALLSYLQEHEAALSRYHIADTLGAFYNIYFDRYDKYYDLFLTGNFGMKTPAEVVSETVSAEPDCCFILWADDESDTVFGYYGDDIREAFDTIRQTCTLTETLYGADGVTPRWQIYQAQ